MSSENNKLSAKEAGWNKEDFQGNLNYDNKTHTGDGKRVDFTCKKSNKQ